MRIPVCTILLNTSDTERQTISYDTADKLLYSSAQDEPLDKPMCETLDEAEEICRIAWGIDPSNVWDFQWIER